MQCSLSPHQNDRLDLACWNLDGALETGNGNDFGTIVGLFQRIW